MARENQSHGWHAERELLDHELDAALAKYAAVEPRVGLEERVLAHLRAERERTPKRTWWSWSVASAAVAAVVIVMMMMMALLWRTNLRHRQVIAWHPAADAPSVGHPGAPFAAMAGNGAHPLVHPPVSNPTTRRAAHPAHPAAVAEAAPKLDQFPSPQPLSEQERILASYVEQYPERSVLLARARTEALQKDQLEEMKPLPFSDWAADSEDQNSQTTQR